MTHPIIFFKPESFLELGKKLMSNGKFYCTSDNMCQGSIVLVSELCDPGLKERFGGHCSLEGPMYWGRVNNGEIEYFPMFESMEAVDLGKYQISKNYPGDFLVVRDKETDVIHIFENQECTIDSVNIEKLIDTVQAHTVLRHLPSLENIDIPKGTIAHTAPRWKLKYLLESMNGESIVVLNCEQYEDYYSVIHSGRELGMVDCGKILRSGKNSYLRTERGILHMKEPNLFTFDAELLVRLNEDEYDFENFVRHANRACFDVPKFGTDPNDD